MHSMKFQTKKKPMRMKKTAARNIMTILDGLRSFEPPLSLTKSMPQSPLKIREQDGRSREQSVHGGPTL